ncbi:MAG: ATP-binding protein [Bacteroidota bacterium]
MKTYYHRILESTIRTSLSRNPVTAVLGPRQCGKSTLVQHIINDFPDAVYLDLERPSDLAKLEEAEWFLQLQQGKLVCLDEIQRVPELFPLLRSLVDEAGRNGMYLILGSASRELLQQSSESLAGRISFKQLTPFLWSEVNTLVSLEDYLSKGGFPRSLLAEEDASFEWRLDFITTFLERDLLQFAGFTPSTMRRLWQMLAHSNGQTANFSALGKALGVSNTTIRNYIELLEGTFLGVLFSPYAVNTKKRLIKSPKVYLSDAGILLALLRLKNFEQAIGHPVFGSLWETIVLSNLWGHFPSLDIYFYRTNHGNEIDFLLSDGVKMIAIECKASKTPKLSKGTYNAIEDVQPDATYLVAPIQGEAYFTKGGIQILSLDALIAAIKAFF